MLRKFQTISMNYGLKMKWFQRLNREKKKENKIVLCSCCYIMLLHYVCSMKHKCMFHVAVI